MSYQQRLAQTLRIGLKYLRERNMVDVSSNGLVELQPFLDALGRIEDLVTTAIEVYDAAGADTHLNIIMINNSRYIIDDDAENVPLVDDGGGIKYRVRVISVPRRLSARQHNTAPLNTN